MRKIPDEILNPARLIQFVEKDAINGFYVLLRSGQQVAAYANNTYVVGVDHLKLLRRVGVPFKILRK